LSRKRTEYEGCAQVNMAGLHVKGGTQKGGGALIFTEGRGREYRKDRSGELQGEQEEIKEEFKPWVKSKIKNLRSLRLSLKKKWWFKQNPGGSCSRQEVYKVGKLGNNATPK